MILPEEFLVSNRQQEKNGKQSMSTNTGIAELDILWKKDSCLPKSNFSENSNYNNNNRDVP